MPLVAMLMDLEIIILSEVSHTEKDKYMILLICRILKILYKWTYSQNTDLENELVVTSGEGWEGGIDWGKKIYSSSHYFLLIFHFHFPLLKVVLKSPAIIALLSISAFRLLIFSVFYFALLLIYLSFSSSGTSIMRIVFYLLVFIIQQAFCTLFNIFSLFFSDWKIANDLSLSS